MTPTTTPEIFAKAIIGSCADAAVARRQPGAACEGDHHPEDLRKAIIGSCAGDEQLQELALRRVGVAEALLAGPGPRPT